MSALSSPFGVWLFHGLRIASCGLITALIACSGIDPDMCDADGDGYGIGECNLALDCDDQEASISPDAREIPYDGIDQDCDGKDAVDLDGDGWASSEVQDGFDCDDADASIHPGALETCDDPSDQDCDGLNGVPEIPYDGIDQDCDGQDQRDIDGDGHAGAVVAGDDCDDLNADVYPGALEVCDGIDQDCSRIVDDVDQDGDGAWGCPETVPEDCDDHDASISPGAEELVCDGIDQDCDGQDVSDQDGDGFAASSCDGDDCDDQDPSISPGGSEIPYDGLDQDCDGQDLTDVDQDGFAGLAVGGDDCDDTDADISPDTDDPTGFRVRVVVPAGSFLMGSDDSSASSDAMPLHQVQMSAFCIDQYEVTNARYRACVEAGICEPPNAFGSFTRAHYYDDNGYDDYPVLYVTWTDAQTFCSAWEGGTLPSEAQWEKSARGGCETHGDAACSSADAPPYPWGTASPTCDRLNYDYCTGDTAPVDGYPDGQSPYGIRQLTGNASEWTYDYYDADAYQACFEDGVQIEIPVDPTGPETGSLRTIRGSAFTTPPAYVTVYPRSSSSEGSDATTGGFRCAWPSREAIP